MTTGSVLPGVVLLGGDTNALAIARSLGRRGVEVSTLGADAFVGSSRFVRELPEGHGAEPAEDRWAAFLLGPEATRHHGSLLLAASDTGITVLLRHREALAGHYLLDACEPTAQAAMLDKLAGYEWARDAGVPTPLFWRVGSTADLHRLRDELVYPLIVRPLLSHEYQRTFRDGTKYQVAHDFEELERTHGEMTGAGLSVMLTEKIPGGDDHLRNYTTYVDRTGRHTVDYTNRVIRRRPPNHGVSSYRATTWDPAVRDAGRRLIAHAGLRGVVAVEFIRDDRDGALKLIECNARFEAPLPLMIAAGLDFPWHVYRQALGEEHELPHRYRVDRRMLYPSDDVRSFLALRRDGQLGARAWLAGLAHRQTFPVWSARDPRPALARGLARSATGFRAAVSAVREAGRRDDHM